jgi:hypothetical protein
MTSSFLSCFYKFEKLLILASVFSVLVILAGFYSLSYAQEPEILDRRGVEKYFQMKLDHMRVLIREGKVEALKAAVADLSGSELIALFEFNLKMPNITGLPPQKAYFNREPFIALFGNSSLLNKDNFEMSYKLDKFQPQYGGASAILFDSGTASGELNEPFSGETYRFSLIQTCRNTISADAQTVFKVDSIYCRMDIDYTPLNKDAKEAEGIEGKPIEKPPIADIISDIEHKTKQAE